MMNIEVGQFGHEDIGLVQHVCSLQHVWEQLLSDQCAVSIITRFDYAYAHHHQSFGSDTSA
jgi:hypothetical protein